MSVCLSFCWSAVFLSACCLQLAYYVLSCRLVFAAFAFADDVAATVAVVAAAAALMSLTWHLPLFLVYALHGRLLPPVACTFKVVVPVYSPPFRSAACL